MLKSLVKRGFRRFGFDLSPYLPVYSQTAQLIRVLSTHDVNLVLDVGANIGQFGKILREAGYEGRIVSFEPLLAARERLLEASRKDPLWEIAPRAAIGGEDGEIDIHVAKNSISSSALDMLDTHVRIAPESRYVGSEHVQLLRLDSIAPNYLRPESVTFLKIDTQGYEDRVLQGAAGMMERMAGLHLELSLVPLYEGQRLFSDLYGYLVGKGFDLWGIWPAFTDPRTGRLLQVDATFFRRG